MTFFLGLFSILMMVVLPGAILLKICKAGRYFDPCFFVTNVFALSLIINLILVFGLTLIHQYRTPILQDICAIECLLFVLLYQNVWEQKLDWQTGFKWLYHYPLRQKPLQTLAFIVSCLALYNWSASFGNPFGLWDPTVSYNRWATDFAANQIPSLTWHYPQLLPANWSMSYVLIGPLPEHIQLEFFPAAIQGFFPIGILLLCWTLYRQEKNPAYLTGLITFAILFSYEFGRYFNLGYADIPVTFFNLLAITCTVLAFGAHSSRRHLLINMAIFAAIGAAMTKPAGIYTAFILPILQELLDPLPAYVGKKATRLICKYVILTLAIAPWYIYSSLHESNTGAFSDVSFLVHDMTDSNWLAEIYNALSEAFIILALIALCGVFHKWIPRPWKMIIYCYLPYFFIWIGFFSYDERNLEIFWPIMCLATGFVLTYDGYAWRVFKKIKPWPDPLRVWMLIVAGVLMIGFYGMIGILSTMNLLVHQEQAKNFSLNALPVTMRLYAYKLCPGFQGKILTDYAYFNYLPMLKNDMSIPPLDSYNKNMEPGYFDNLPAFLQYMQAHPEIHYLLLNHTFDSLYESPLWSHYFHQWILEKKISIEFEGDNVGLYKINVSHDQLADIDSTPTGDSH
jgi:hypothetical protein